MSPHEIRNQRVLSHGECKVGEIFYTGPLPEIFMLWCAAFPSSFVQFQLQPKVAKNVSDGLKFLSN